jgi:hypothetical protein
MRSVRRGGRAHARELRIGGRSGRSQTEFGENRVKLPPMSSMMG